MFTQFEKRDLWSKTPDDNENGNKSYENSTLVTLINAEEMYAM